MKAGFKIILFLVLFLGAQARSEVAPSSSGRPTLSSQIQACQAYVDSPLCQKFQGQEGLLKPEECKADLLGENWSALSRFENCGKGLAFSAGELLNFLWEALVFIAKSPFKAVGGIYHYLTDGDSRASTHEALNQAWRSSADYLQSMYPYLAIEYQKAYDQVGPPWNATEATRGLRAVMAVRSKLVSGLMGAVQEIIKAKYAEFHCFNNNKQTEMTCKLMGDIFFPPAVAFTLIKNGVKGLRALPQLTAKLDEMLKAKAGPETKAVVEPKVVEEAKIVKEAKELKLGDEIVKGDFPDERQRFISFEGPPGQGRSSGRIIGYDKGSGQITIEEITNSGLIQRGLTAQERLTVKVSETAKRNYDYVLQNQRVKPVPGIHQPGATQLVREQFKSQLYHQDDALKAAGRRAYDEHFKVPTSPELTAIARAEGRIIEHRASGGAKLAEGTYTYVITTEGRLITGKVEDVFEFGVKHSNLARGKKVVSAGEIQVFRDGSYAFNSESGSYSAELIKARAVTAEELRVRTQESLKIFLGDSGKFEKRILLPESEPSMKSLTKYCGAKSFLQFNREACCRIVRIGCH